MAYNYSTQSYNNDHMARAVGRALPISTKASIEICLRIKHKSVARAKTILKDAIALRKPIQFTRFTNGVGHRRKMASGRYPQIACQEILNLIESVEANAQFKGLNTADLVIAHISAQDAGNVWRYGRFRRRKAKRTHIEVVVAEGQAKEEKKAQEKPKKGTEKK